MDEATEKTLKAIMDEFPYWCPWRGVNGMWYARRPRSTPPITVRAHNLTVLRERIAARERMQG